MPAGGWRSKSYYTAILPYCQTAIPPYDMAVGSLGVLGLHVGAAHDDAQFSLWRPGSRYEDAYASPSGTRFWLLSAGQPKRYAAHVKVAVDDPGLRSDDDVSRRRDFLHRLPELRLAIW